MPRRRSDQSTPSVGHDFLPNSTGDPKFMLAQEDGVIPLNSGPREDRAMPTVDEEEISHMNRPDLRAVENQRHRAQEMHEPPHDVRLHDFLYIDAGGMDMGTYIVDEISGSQIKAREVDDRVGSQEFTWEELQEDYGPFTFKPKVNDMIDVGGQMYLVFEDYGDSMILFPVARDTRSFNLDDVPYEVRMDMRMTGSRRRAQEDDDEGWGVFEWGDVFGPSDRDLGPQKEYEIPPPPEGFDSEREAQQSQEPGGAVPSFQKSEDLGRARDDHSDVQNDGTNMKDYSGRRSAQNDFKEGDRVTNLEPGAPAELADRPMFGPGTVSWTDGTPGGEIGVKHDNGSISSGWSSEYTKLTARRQTRRTAIGPGDRVMFKGDPIGQVDEVLDQSVFDPGDPLLRIKWNDGSTSDALASDLEKVARRYLARKAMRGVRFASKESTATLLYGEDAIREGLAMTRRAGRLRRRVGMRAEEVIAAIERHEAMLPVEIGQKYRNMLRMGMNPDEVMADWDSNLEAYREIPL